MGFGFRDEHGFQLLLCIMRVRRVCVTSASEWCVGVRIVVRWGIDEG